MTPLNRSPLHLLHRAGQCASDLFRAEMQVDGLTPRQHAILTALQAGEGVSQTTLVERTGVDRSTLAEVMHRMHRKGLLRRVRTEADTRAYACTLTDAGKRALRAADPCARTADDRLLAAIPEPERAAFVSHLAAVVQALAEPAS